MSSDRYLQRLRVCHTADRAAFEPWFVGAALAGHVHVERVARLLVPPTPFVRSAGRLQLLGADFAARSQAVAQLARCLAAEGLARAPLGELYPVAAEGSGEELLQVDRAVVPWFGVKARGVHLNGFVRTPAGLELWVARRSRGKRTFPGHLDNLVAGGQSIGLSARATLEKECHEEAGLPAALAAQALSVGELSYVQQDGQALKPDTLACFDLELPADFVPRPVDGEVESFVRWPLPTVAASLRSEEAWKPNCALVVLHFLLRHGGLDGELSAGQRETLWRALRGEPT